MQYKVRENLTTKTMEILKDDLVEYEIDIEYALDLAWVINNFVKYPLARQRVYNLSKELDKHKERLVRQLSGKPRLKTRRRTTQNT